MNLYGKLDNRTDYNRKQTRNWFRVDHEVDSGLFYAESVVRVDAIKKNIKKLWPQYGKYRIKKWKDKYNDSVNKKGVLYYDA